MKWEQRNGSSGPEGDPERQPIAASGQWPD